MCANVTAWSKVTTTPMYTALPAIKLGGLLLPGAASRTLCLGCALSSVWLARYCVQHVQVRAAHELQKSEPVETTTAKKELDLDPP